MATPQIVRDVLAKQGHEEGRLTSRIEEQTAKFPSVLFLNLAFASIATSLGIAVVSKRPQWATFVGLWAPAFMLMGIYNKIVKVKDEI